MTITSNGSGSGGTFSSFFDVFFEISLDGGGSFTPGGPLHLTSSGTAWSTIASGLLVNGLVGDQAANFHTNKNSNACPGFNATVCVDFFSGPVREAHPDGSVHSAQSATTAVPEPGSVALFGLGLAAIAGLRRRRA